MGNSTSSDEAPPAEDKSYYGQAKTGYSALVNAIIRPPRATYTESDLGPKEFKWHGRRFRRFDLTLTNRRGLRLACSHWVPVGAQGARPCVIYLHGNSSARVEALPQLAPCLSIGASVFAFDFAGSGQSEGEWVSLGHWEREDLATVIEHLRSRESVSTIGLWGRSMGAVTALLHTARDPSIAAMVCDGAFADLEQLADELVNSVVKNELSIVPLLASVALGMVKTSVRREAQFEFEDVSTLRVCASCFVPALFVAGEGDTFVAPHHSRQLHAAHAGDNNLVMVEGDHNSARPRFLQDSAATFLRERLGAKPEWLIREADTHNNGLPPWVEDADALNLNLAELGLDLGDLGLDRASFDTSVACARPGEVDLLLDELFGGHRSLHSPAHVAA